MRVSISKPTQVEPVVDHGGGNTTDANNVSRYRGWSLYEAVNAACSVGTLYAWEWLQAWWAAELDEDDGGPDEETV